VSSASSHYALGSADAEHERLTGRLRGSRHIANGASAKRGLALVNIRPSRGECINFEGRGHERSRLSHALWRILALPIVSAVVNYIDRGGLSTAPPPRT